MALPEAAARALARPGLRSIHPQPRPHRCDRHRRGPLASRVAALKNRIPKSPVWRRCARSRSRDRQIQSMTNTRPILMIHRGSRPVLFRRRRRRRRHRRGTRRRSGRLRRQRQWRRRRRWRSKFDRPRRLRDKSSPRLSGDRAATCAAGHRDGQGAGRRRRLRGARRSCGFVGLRRARRRCAGNSSVAMALCARPPRRSCRRELGPGADTLCFDRGQRYAELAAFDGCSRAYLEKS